MLTGHWQRADAIQEEISSLVTALSDNPSERFQEILDFIETRRKGDKNAARKGNETK
jgi:hypothetical protein